MLDFVIVDYATPRRNGRGTGASWTLRPPQLLRRRELLHRALLRWHRIDRPRWTGRLRRPSQGPPPRRLFERAESFFLEIFASCCRLSSGAAEAGLRVIEPVELNHGPWLDMLDRRVEKTVGRWIRTQKVWCVHFGTPCSRWSRARTCARADSPVDALGTRCAAVTMRLLRKCLAKKVWFTIENPASSELWSYPPWARLLRQSGAVDAVFPMCRLGADYAKATRMSGTLPGLQKLDCRCRCVLLHEHVNGMAVFETNGVRRTVWKTSLAGKYPPAFCRSLGALLADVAPVGAWCPKGEAEVLPGWACSLGAATGHPEAEGRLLAKLPTRWASEWHDAVKIIMDRIVGAPTRSAT